MSYLFIYSLENGKYIFFKISTLFYLFAIDWDGEYLLVKYLWRNISQSNTQTGRHGIE